MVGRFVSVLALVLSAAGCSSSSNGTTTDAGSTSTNGNDSGATTSAALKAPTITMVMQMDGALHVMWTNAQTDCDTVEGERKTTGSYSSLFSIPGTADNKMDATATDDMTYTYRLRCKKGTAYSPYSNEMGGNPMSGMNMDAGMDSGMDMDSGMGMD